MTQRQRLRHRDRDWDIETDKDSDSVRDRERERERERERKRERYIYIYIYIDCLLNLLSASKISCYIQEMFVGAQIYADDIALLALSARAMHSLL